MSEGNLALAYALKKRMQKKGIARPSPKPEPAVDEMELPELPDDDFLSDEDEESELSFEPEPEESPTAILEAIFKKRPTMK